VLKRVEHRLGLVPDSSAPGRSRAWLRRLLPPEQAADDACLVISEIPSDWRLFEEWLRVQGRRTLEWSRGLRARLLPDEQERTDEELAEESHPAEDVAVLEADVWLEVVRRGLNVAVLAAVEAQALGGLVVLLRAAGLDVVAAREGPRVVVEDRRGLGAEMERKRWHRRSCPGMIRSAC
jgi:hypothetical protein